MLSGRDRAGEPGVDVVDKTIGLMLRTGLTGVGIGGPAGVKSSAGSARLACFFPLFFRFGMIDTRCVKIC